MDDLVEDHSESSSTAEHAHHGTMEDFSDGGRFQVTIDTLPDETLLHIFEYYLDNVGDNPECMKWKTLVHVCGRWRDVVFGSPRRLDLRLFCGPRTPVNARLDIWPPILIVLFCYMLRTSNLANIVMALKHNDRARKIEIWDVPYQLMKDFAAVMRGPFPELTYLEIENKPRHVGPAPVLPDSFLSGSAPRLRFLKLVYIPFPGLPKLLLSARALVRLWLISVPPGHILAEEMATALSTMTRLEEFYLGFEPLHEIPASDSLHESQRIRSPMRQVLPALKMASFKGASEYLEDIVVSIDAPQIDYLHISFHSQRSFNLLHLSQFISRARQLNRLHVIRGHRSIGLPLPTQISGDDRLDLEILHR